MKTTTLIDRYKEGNIETESQPEVDNGVYPLHWATSLSPSPMGTDPINGFKKMVQMVLDSGNQFQQYGQKSARPLLWTNTNWLSKAKKSQMKQRR